MSEIFDSTDRESSFPTERPRERRSRPGIFWPLVLITIGVVFLLRNTGYMDDDALGLVLRLWPAIFIIGALDEIFRGEVIVGPGFWIAAGVILIMANLEMLRWDAFSIIIYLWPLILVSIGLDLLTRKRHFIFRILALGAILGLMIGALFFLGARGARASKTISQELEGASEVEVRLKPVAGSVQVGRLANGSDTDLLVSGTAASEGNLIADFDAGTGIYRLERTGFPAMPDSGGWNLSFTPNVELEMNTDMAVGRVEYDFTGLQISAFNIDLALGSVEVILPEEGSLDGLVDFAIGNVEILVPGGLGVRVRTDGAIVTNAYPDDYSRDGDFIISPGYEDAENQADISVNLAIGRLAIRTITP